MADTGDTPTVAILDAGAQYAKVIDRKIRELSVHSVILPLETPVAELSEFKAVVISGGPQSVYAADAPSYDPALFEMLSSAGVPVLGICYGMQLMMQVFGGQIERQEVREDGQFPIDIAREGATDAQVALFAGIQSPTEVLLTHGDSVVEAAPGFYVCAKSSEGIISAVADPDRGMYGVQFHPEVDLSVEGMTVFSNFLFSIARVPATYTVGCRHTAALELIRSTVGPARSVLVLVSGGVDSTVCAALCHEALGAGRVIGLHVDSGFMRANESAMVMEALAGLGLSELHVVDARDTFLDAVTDINGVTSPALRDVVDPETKRKIIGDTFMRVTDAKLRELGLDPDQVVLAQGTLRPDLIESASSLANAGATAEVIKTHHNDTQLVRQLRDLGRIVEPLKEYHKDEVRALGAQLGLADSLLWRQPFPGPGLAIRVLCAETPYHPPEHEAMWRALEAHASDGHRLVLLPVRTVGVQGDGRSYASLAGIVGTAGTPRAGDVDWTAMRETVKALPKQVHGVNRVCYVFHRSPEDAATGHDALATVTPTTLGGDAVPLLRAADAVVNSLLAKHHLLRVLSQAPVVLCPADFGVHGGYAVAVRTLITRDFMTGMAAVPGTEAMPIHVLDEIVEALFACDDRIVRVLYDLTSKPPGTTEWE